MRTQNYGVERVFFDRALIHRCFTAAEINKAQSMFVGVCGGGGVGKTTVIRGLLARHPDRLRFLPQIMTREPRDDEQDGVDLIYRKEKEFLAEVDQGKFFLAYRSCRHPDTPPKFSGWTLDQIHRAIADRRRCILIPNVRDVRDLRRLFSDVGCVIVDHAAPWHAQYRRERGLPPDDSADYIKLLEKVRSGEYPVPGALWIQNPPGQIEETLDALERFILRDDPPRW